jgi:hypothetical protein
VTRGASVVPVARENVSRCFLGVSSWLRTASYIFVAITRNSDNVVDIKGTARAVDRCNRTNLCPFVGVFDKNVRSRDERRF